MSGELYELALGASWQMTAPALEALLSIAAREPLPSDEIATRMHGPLSLALRNGQRRPDSGRVTMHGAVAVIPIDGVIHRYADFFTSASGGITTEALARDITTALDDPAVSALVLVSDSPGGEITGIGELTDMLYQARGRKPIVGYVEGYGASAAYRILSAADQLILDSDASVGSIGTIIGVPDPTKRPRYHIEFVSSQSPKKRADPTTDAGRALFQQRADDLTATFIAHVARNRNLDAAQILDIGGGLLIGQQAIDAGLADALGSEASVIAALNQGGLAALRSVHPSIHRPTRHGQPAVQEEPMPVNGDGKSFWAAFWGGAKEAGIVPEATEAQDAPRTLTLTARQLETLEAASAPLQPASSQQEANSEIERLRRELATARAERIQSDAAAFAKEQLTTGHALPAEQAAIVALYSRAAELDAATPRTDGQPTCVTLVQAAYSARPAHQLANNLVVGTTPGTVLTNATGKDDYATDAEATADWARRTNGTKGR